VLLSDNFRDVRNIDIADFCCCDDSTAAIQHAIAIAILNDSTFILNV